MLRFVIAGLLIAHGLIHASFLQKAPPASAGGPQWPFNLDHSWLLSGIGLPPAVVTVIGTVLVLATVAGFGGTGFGFLLHQGWWRPLAIGSAAVSALLLVLFFKPWLAAGPIIDAGIVAGIFWANWPVFQEAA